MGRNAQHGLTAKLHFDSNQAWKASIQKLASNVKKIPKTGETADCWGRACMPATRIHGARPCRSQVRVDKNARERWRDPYTSIQQTRRDVKAIVNHRFRRFFSCQEVVSCSCQDPLRVDHHALDSRTTASSVAPPASEIKVLDGGL